MSDRLISAAIGGVVVAAILWQPGFVQSAEWRTHDILSGMLRPAAPSGRVMIVEVDEKSLSAVGRWPWPRDVLGRLVEKLLDAGASTVVLDVMFPEPDRSAPGLPRLAARGMKGAAPAAGEAAANNDAALAAAFRAGRVVAGYHFNFEGAPGGPDCELRPLPLQMAVYGDTVPAAPFEAPGAHCPVPPVAEAAAGLGFLNALPDADGRLRRAPLLIESHGRKYPSLALAALLAMRPRTTVSLVSGGQDAYRILVDDVAIPVDGRGRLQIRFRGGREAFSTIPAAAVLSGEAPVQAVANKIAVVGGSAAGLQDTVATPMDPLMSGVEVQANLIDNLLAGDFARPASQTGFWECVLALLGAAAMARSMRVLKPRWTALSLIAMTGALWGASALLLAQWNVFISPLAPTVAMGAVFCGLAVSNWNRQLKASEGKSRQAENMRRFTFSALVGLVELRNAETSEHAKRLQIYVTLLCDGLAKHPRFERFLDPETVALLIELVPLHDIGKVGVPDSILLKRGRLTAEEFVIVKRHVDDGRTILENAYRDSGLDDRRMLTMATEVVSAHHERWDGSGYPAGLKGDEIPAGARLLAVADVYDALVSRRVYKDSIPHRTACEIIRSGRGKEFDPDVVDAFLAGSEAWESKARRWREPEAEKATGA